MGHPLLGRPQNRGMTPPPVIIFHETDGRKYYRIVEGVCDALNLPPPLYREIVVTKRLGKDLLRRVPPAQAFKRFADNLGFRLQLRSLRGHVILSGLPPFDLRVRHLNALTRRNAMIYHNSWHDWSGGNQPRRYGPLTGLAMDGWRTLTAPPTRLVCISPASQAGLGEFAGQTPSLIPHAVEDSFGVITARPQDQPLKVLYVGFLETRKGIGEVLACAQRLPHIHFTVLGDGPRRAEVEAAASTGRLSYHGHVKDRARILEIFRDHDVLLLPSRRTPSWEELFGRVIIEAMATGMPVAASDHIGPKLLIAPGVDGELFREGDVDGYVGWLEALAQDRPRLEQMRSAARVKASAYLEQAVSAAWTQVIADALVDAKRKGRTA